MSFLMNLFKTDKTKQNNEISEKRKCNFKLNMNVIIMKICLMSLKLNANVNVIPYEYV